MIPTLSNRVFVDTLFFCVLIKMPDFLTTWYGFSLRRIPGVTVRERSSVPRYVIKNTGFGGLFIYTILISALVSFSISASNDVIATLVTSLWVISSIIPAVLNSYRIIHVLYAARRF